MAKNKTAETLMEVTEFVSTYVVHEQKKSDSLHLVDLMRQWSGYEPKMWGPTIIGFGKYHYKYPSGHEGEAPIIAFSPRKAEFSLYLLLSSEHSKHLLPHLGKYKMGKACIYFKKMSDINLDVLEQMCKLEIEQISQRYTVQ